MNNKQKENKFRLIKFSTANIPIFDNDVKTRENRVENCVNFRSKHCTITNDNDFSIRINETQKACSARKRFITRCTRRFRMTFGVVFPFLLKTGQLRFAAVYRTFERIVNAPVT
uniref:Uncharacterized protein n=1 Tax=Romanomermis culicivorax TaxID=13658 RepID=A0A915L415_ROMCU